MSIPDYQSLMLPLLELTKDGQEHSFRDVVDILAEKFHLTEEEKKELLPSGQYPVFDNRVGWAKTYMKKAGLLDSTRRGFIKIAKRGLDVLKQNPKYINAKFLKQYPEFIEFQTIKKEKDKTEIESEEISDKTPEESIGIGYQNLRRDLESELLTRVKECSPYFFERLVIDLLVKLGYGGSRLDAGKAIGKSGDGGIDGIIKEDRLGLDIVYIQAKRWNETVVGRPEIHKFVGALEGKRARKGVFITTSLFSKDAREYVSGIDKKVILIDGQELAQLMIDHNVGISTVTTYEIKKIDSDYFSE